MARPAHKCHRQKLFFPSFFFTRRFGRCLEDVTHKEEASQLLRTRTRWHDMKTTTELLPGATAILSPEFNARFHDISPRVYVLYPVCFMTPVWLHPVRASPPPHHSPLPNWNCFAFNGLINARPSIHPLSRSSSRGHRGAQSFQETGYTADCFIAGSVTRACAHFTCLGPFWEEGRRPKVIRNRWNLCDLSNMVLFRVRKDHFQSKFTCLVLK